MQAKKYKSKLYTKDGDKGKSCLYSDKCLSKASIEFQVLGTVDELNCSIGHAIAHCVQDKVSEHKIKQLKEVQSRLFDVGAHVATPRSPSTDKEKLEETTFSPIHTQNLEHWIDEICSTLEPLKTFVLPSGGLSATSIHVARAVCRRCERLLSQLLEQAKIENTVFEYMNRLSDYLFVLARSITKETGNIEEYWIKSEI